MGGELPEYYKQFFDPFIGLTAAAAATEKLKVGTSVCLVPEHNTMNLAKMVACLDRVSNGRFLFGLGGDGMPRKWPIMALNSRTAGRSRASASWH